MAGTRRVGRLRMSEGVPFGLAAAPLANGAAGNRIYMSDHALNRGTEEPRMVEAFAFLSNALQKVGQDMEDEPTVSDAGRAWMEWTVTPGFIDLHTHLDA